VFEGRARENIKELYVKQQKNNFLEHLIIYVNFL